MEEMKTKGAQKNKSLILTLGFFFLGVSFHGCDYERMKEQESVRTYETRLPSMPSGTIPASGGLLEIVSVDPNEMRNPLEKDSSNLAKGREAFMNYCSMCHGAAGDGLGTVGQSFYPLPSDLHSDAIQSLSDGELFRIISLGSRRSPPLGHTISEEDRWAIVLHLRALGGQGN